MISALTPRGAADVVNFDPRIWPRSTWMMEIAGDAVPPGLGTPLFQFSVWPVVPDDGGPRHGDRQEAVAVPPLNWVSGGLRPAW